ncbi:MAG: cytochrome c [Gemmatimonadetes bacterium]|nr:cytochrome c [Gemmatimonadota bacterium]
MKWRNALFAACCLVVAGCSVEDWRRSPGPDDLVALVPWFANMYNHVAIPPLKSWCAPDRPDCRQPVPGTVPITGVDPVVLPIQLAPTPANIRDLGRRFRNPMESTAESIERGRDRYDINCRLCHGDRGVGDGPVSAAMGGGAIVPSLVTPRVAGFTDGYLYAVIVNGRGAFMKPYGHRVRGDDRWHVVNYIRVLQGTAQ